MNKRSIVAQWYQLSGVDFRLCEQLFYYERVFSKVFPSQKTLAYRLKCSVRTVRRSIAHLRYLGLIQVKARKFQERTGHWHSQTNLYKLCSFLGAKVRGILNRLTGRPQAASPTRNIKKSYLSFDFSTIKDSKARQILERWQKRGDAKS